MATSPPLSPPPRAKGRRLSSFHAVRTPSRHVSAAPGQHDPSTPLRPSATASLNREPLTPLSSPNERPRANGRRLSSFHTAEKPARHTSATPRRRVPITPSRPGTAAPRSCGPRGSVAATNAKATNAHTPGRRKAGVPVAPDAAAHVALPPTRMSDAALADMYSTTIKLCQDGKINAKNTWSLNLIDYMETLVTDGNGDGGNSAESAMSREDADGHTNFQVAGVTLDAGVRIYCSRVDSVHSNAFKVLGALSRTSNPNATGDSEDIDGDDEGGNRKKRKRGAHRSGGNTLECNIELLTVHKLETDLAVDPLFQKMSAAFDEGGAKGMLLNNLAVANHSEVIFDSSEPMQLESGPQPQREISTFSIKEVLPSAMDDNEDSGTALVLCPRFLVYYHSKMDGCRDDDNTVDEGSKAAVALGDSEQADFDFDYNEGDLVGSDANLGLPPPSADDHVHEDDNGFADLIEDDDDAGVFDTQISSPNTRRSLRGGHSFKSGAVDLLEAGMLLHCNSEYSFFDSNALSSWAGPQHWRFRAALATTVTRDNGGDKNGKAEKKSKGKTAMLLDYSSEAPNIDFAAEFARPKKTSSCLLSDGVQDGYTEKKVTLPDDLHFKTQTLATLFLKPKVLVVAKRQRTTDESKTGLLDTEEDNAARGWYDFENDGDNDDFGAADDDNANAIFEFGDDLDKVEGLNLVPKPTLVEPMDIGFATVAKKVDVRLLKSGMWAQLRAGSKDAFDEQQEDSTKGDSLPGSVEDAENQKVRESTSSGDADDVRAGGVQTLQQVVDNMHKFVPESSLPDVSLSYVFICLLHLANEKTLSLKPASEGALDNLLISSTHESSDSEESSQ